MLNSPHKGHNERNDMKDECCINEENAECCCVCKHQLVAHVCNCFSEWPETLITNRSPYNEKHGDIGWICLGLAFDGSGAYVKRGKHGRCEEFSNIIQDLDEESTEHTRSYVRRNETS